MSHISQKLIIGVAIGVLTTFTVAQALLITNVWNPSWNPFRPSPEKILFQAFDNLGNIESAKTASYAIGTLTQDGVDVFTGSVSVSSNNQTVNNKRVGEGMIAAEVKLEGVAIEFNAEYRLVGDKMYFKIITLPFLSYVQALSGLDLSSVRDEWIVVDVKDLQTQNSTVQNEELQKRIQQTAIQLLHEKKLLTNIQSLPNESIEGTQTYHINLTIRKEGLAELLQPVLESMKEENDSAVSFIAEQTEKSLRKTLDAIGDVPIDVWIGKQNMLPRRVRVTKDFNIKDFADEFPDSSQIDGTLSMLFQIDITDYNKPINTQVPTNAKTIEEIFGSTSFGQSLFGARSAARDARRQSDIRQIGTAMELYYNKHGQYLPSLTLPSSIEDIISITPTDPGGGACENYQWISNISNPQLYCVYACLEDGGYFVSNPDISTLLVSRPNSLSCQ